VDIGEGSLATTRPDGTPLQPGDEGYRPGHLMRGKPSKKYPDGEPIERTSVRSLVEWGAVIVGALIVALIIKTFLFQAFYIPSESMVPTLKVGDRVLVNKLSYEVHDVHRGDVVVFERPPSETPDPIKDLIKRVIGLPGDELESQDGVVIINGKRLDEPYLADGVRTENLEKQTVPKGMVFVMGDNRGDSLDSRIFGPISQKLIVGRAFVRVYPITHLSGL
jgi:signal peptidase I